MPEMSWMMQGGRKKNNVTSVVVLNNTNKTLDLTPGTAKRWLVLRAKMVNPDDVARNLNIKHYDVSNNLLDQIVANNARNQNEWHVYPSLAHNSLDESGGLPNVIVEGTEYLRFAWDAGGASAGGTDADGLICQVMEAEI